MSEEKPKGQMPEYVGEAEFVKDGIQMRVKTAVWVKQDKNGKTHLSLNFGGINTNLFKFEPKQKQEEDMSKLV